MGAVHVKIIYTRCGGIKFTYIVQKEFNHYCLERKIVESFETSDYKKNMDIF